MTHNTEPKALTSEEIELVAGGSDLSPAQQAKMGAPVKGIEDFTPEKSTIWTLLGFPRRP